MPVEDASVYHQILSQRAGGGTHTLKIVEGETHNWTRPYDEPVNGILDWLAEIDGPAAEGKRHAGAEGTREEADGDYKAKARM